MPPTTRSATARSNANATGREPAAMGITNEQARETSIANTSDSSNANNSVSSFGSSNDNLITNEQAGKEVAALLQTTQMEVKQNNDRFNDIKEELNDFNDIKEERLKLLKKNIQVIREGKKKAEEIYRAARMLV